MPGVTMPLGEAVCTRCEVGFDPSEQIVNSAGELWHPDCFVCAQCFQPFPDGVFYEFEGRKYCEHDFQVLFAPCCQQCNEFIIGRVIKAMNASWHPACFRCNMCSKELADLGFIKNGNQALCHDCNARIRLQGTGRYMCHKCHAVVDGEPLRFRGELYHPYHFNCKACGIELDSRAREVKSRAGYTSCRAERAVLSALPRQDGHPDMWRVPPAHRGASGHRARQELARGAFRVRQVREALPGPPPLREEGSGVLPHRLPPALRKHLLCVQLRRRGRSGALAEQGLVPASLRLQRLRSAAHAQVQVLRDGHETGVQEVLREAAARAAPPPQAAARERGSRHGFRRVHGGRVVRTVLCRFVSNNRLTGPADNVEIDRCICQAAVHPHRHLRRMEWLILVTGKQIETKTGWRVLSRETSCLLLKRQKFSRIVM
ncbi:protein espinas-like isoform X4 [Pollicipes pollicipes]|uniref:protein espinas-like isoform X4 n=1 Tax=Pollicipes pollicipes TaxID=41117 RepID=UPI001885706D|nr:protein espinas-like isoform X4 [Pollicipes pollicipes]